MKSAISSRMFRICRRALFVAATSAMVLPAFNLTAATATPATEQPSANGKLIPVTPQIDATWLAQARADYPLTTCAVSGDAFDGGAMGKPIDYIYREDGKPDRLVRMCCKDCQKDFRKDPAKYLKVIDDAAAAKAKKGA